MQGVSEEKKEHIAWRRNSVNTFLIKGYSQADIARELQLSESTISRDVDYLQQQANETIKNHLEKTLPYEYKKCIDGLTHIIFESYKIMENADDNREKLSSLSLIKDTFQTKMDLLTNASLLKESIKFVESNRHRGENSHSTLEEEDKIEHDVQRSAEVNEPVF